MKKQVRQGSISKLVGDVGSWWFDAVVIVAFSVVALAIWWPVRYLPFIDEAATLIMDGAFVLMERDFQPLALVELRTSQPPGLMVIVAQIWSWFGGSRMAIHAVMLPVLPLFAYGSYKTFEKYLNVQASLLGSFLVIMSPVVIAEFEKVSIHLTVAAVVAMATALWVWKQRIAAVVVLAAAVLVNWSGLLVLPAYAYWLWSASKRPGVRFEYRLLLVPILVLGLWFMYHNSVTGWWLIPSEKGLVLPPNVYSFLTYVWFVARIIFLEQGRWVLTSASAIALAWLYSKRSFDEKDKVLLTGVGLTLLTALVFFSIKGNFLMREAVVMVPMIILGQLVLIRAAIERFIGSSYGWLIQVLLVVSIGIFLVSWKPSEVADQDFRFRLPENLGFQDMVTVGRLAAGTLQGAFPEAKIYGGFPEAYQVTRPYLGYVEEQLDFEMCENFVFDQNQDMVVYVHPYSPTQIACSRITQEYPVTEIDRFEQNGKWVQLYRISGASQSAEAEEG